MVSDCATSMQNSKESLSAGVISHLIHVQSPPVYANEMTDLLLHCINNTSRLDRQYPSFFDVCKHLKNVGLPKNEDVNSQAFRQALDTFERRTALLVFIYDIYGQRNLSSADSVRDFIEIFPDDEKKLGNESKIQSEKDYVEKKLAEFVQENYSHMLNGNSNQPLLDYYD